MYEELKARLLSIASCNAGFQEGYDAIDCLNAIEQLERQLEEARMNYLGAMTDCGNLERQLAERDAELQKYRDAPVVAYLYKYRNCFGDEVWETDPNWGGIEPLLNQNHSSSSRESENACRP